MSTVNPATPANLDFFRPLKAIIADATLTMQDLRAKTFSFSHVWSLFTDFASLFTQVTHGVGTLIETVFSVVTSGVAMADHLAGNTGIEKKTLVLQAVGMTFDTLWPLLPVPLVLLPFKYLATSAVRFLVIQFASRLIEFYLLVRPVTPQSPV